MTNKPSLTGLARWLVAFTLSALLVPGLAQSPQEQRAAEGHVIIGFQEEVFRRDGTEQKVFGQRWPVIGTVMLIADDDKPSSEALSASGPGGREAGQGGSDDRKRLHNSPLLIALYAT